MPVELVGDQTPLEAAAATTEPETIGTIGGSDEPAVPEAVKPSEIGTKPDTDALSPLEAAAEEQADEDPDEAALLREVQGARARKRIAQVNKQKIAAREAQAKAEAERDAMKAERDKAVAEAEFAKPVAEMIRSRYDKYADPLKAASFDMDFMDAFEAAAKANPALGKIAQQIADAIAKGEKPVVDAKDVKAPEPVKAAAPAKDERVDALLREAVTGAAASILEDLKVEPRFAKQITKDLIAKQGYDKKPTKAEVVAAAKAFADEYGYELRELSGAAKAPKKAAVPTGGAPGADVPAGSGGATREEREKPKDMNEWQRSRDERLRALGVR